MTLLEEINSSANRLGMDDIIDSYMNGQYRQLIKQIKMYGPINFVNDLKSGDYDYLVKNPSDKLDILTIYIKFTSNR